IKCPFCAGFAMTNIANSYFKNVNKMPPNGFSPVFTYWMARTMDGLNPQDEGTTLRAVLDVGRIYGFLPSNILPFTGDCTKPVITDKMLAEASKYKIKGYAKVSNFNEICQAIAAGKYVIIGTIVTSINWADGYILVPEGTFLGAHATFLSRYDLAMRYTENGKEYNRFTGGVNSWSEEWGLKGKYWMAEAYTQFKLVDFGNMSPVLDAYAVDFDNLPIPKTENVELPKTEKIITMSTPMQVLPPGYSMLHFRSIYEALGGTVEWSYTADGKILARATIPPNPKEIIIESIQDSDELKILI
ncbi:MAG: hypothetical protein KGZ74_14315, partial [Chitinophagaceae bacterium]|nr:hypothetical protein [Chitinophagaceae bacterium]